jgi:hypothetical protein
MKGSDIRTGVAVLSGSPVRLTCCICCSTVLSSTSRPMNLKQAVQGGNAALSVVHMSRNKVRDQLIEMIQKSCQFCTICFRIVVI